MASLVIWFTIEYKAHSEPEENEQSIGQFGYCILLHGTVERRSFGFGRALLLEAKLIFPFACHRVAVFQAINKSSVFLLFRGERRLYCSCLSQIIFILGLHFFVEDIIFRQ